VNVTDKLKILINSVQLKRKKSNYKLPIFEGDDEMAILSRESNDSFEKIEKAKKELEHRKSQLKSILTSMHDSVFIFDRNNKLIDSYILDNQTSLFAGKKKEALPRNIIEKIIASVEEVKKNKDLVSIEYMIVKNKKKLWYSANISEKKDENGEFDGVIVVARDITESRNMEKGIEEKLLELESLNKLMIGRELKMIELKKKINDLEKNK
jgi:signal transduction histidine kinase